MMIPDTHKLSAENAAELDGCVKRMRELGCIVFAYSPEDVWQVATHHGSEEWDDRVDLKDFAGLAQEDDQMWELLAQVVEDTYQHEVEYWDDPERDERTLTALDSESKLVDEVL
ncbi:hypothetical protein UFOVP1344_33 [uncultured Caudovirales phage]|uniref:Uncharacterized protein n=1 Tax=uncultured Caudovirales phage TaxID=2100421 RepID=A0A6J5SUJ2_9CAUD|nr:hypothetical protein UFOVP1005_33 [uncultured Caudovirales phage]CAB4200210.1 hypothetical protein UFOVP1344_33 [uncultured Caudovirales phage]CAB4218097.1 hypothetical protein UFOVP1602_7 [uncultured Caudovirales phage]